MLVRVLDGDNMAMNGKTRSSFWRGFGSVLSVRRSRNAPVSMMYQGRDLAGTSAGASLRSDWQAILGNLHSAAKDLELNEPVARSQKRRASAR